MNEVSWGTISMIDHINLDQGKYPLIFPDQAACMAALMIQKEDIVFWEIVQSAVSKGKWQAVLLETLNPWKQGCYVRVLMELVKNGSLQLARLASDQKLYFIVSPEKLRSYNLKR